MCLRPAAQAVSWIQVVGAQRVPAVPGMQGDDLKLGEDVCLQTRCSAGLFMMPMVFGRALVLMGLVYHE